MPNSSKPSLIVHGGAWAIPNEATTACEAGCRRALEAGWSILQRGGAAMDAVEAAIVVLEEDPTFDAGFGSHLNRDGHVELDAIVMDGATLSSGAVAAVQRVRNPIRLARKVMESCEHMLLVGDGAERFAAEQGLLLCRPEELIHEREKKAWTKCIQGEHRYEFHFSSQRGTVGAVAQDVRGNIVAGTSTGGTCCKLPGRVGDSPLIGCGCYADTEAGGVSCTGWGEAIMKVVLAKSATDDLRSGRSAQQAADAAVQLLARCVNGTGGLILLDRNGNPGFAFNTPHMAHGYVAPDGSIITAI